MWKVLAPVLAALVLATSARPAWADAGMRAFVAEVIRQLSRVEALVRLAAAVAELERAIGGSLGAA